MCAEQTKTKGHEAECGCRPEDFEKFFEKMKQFCTCEGGFPDCNTFMEAMKDKACCGPVTGRSETDRKTPTGG